MESLVKATYECSSGENCRGHSHYEKTVMENRFIRNTQELIQRDTEFNERQAEIAATLKKNRMRPFKSVDVDIEENQGTVLEEQISTTSASAEVATESIPVMEDRWESVEERHNARCIVYAKRLETSKKRGELICKRKKLGKEMQQLTRERNEVEQELSKVHEKLFIVKGCIVAKRKEIDAAEKESEECLKLMRQIDEGLQKEEDEWQRNPNKPK